MAPRNVVPGMLYAAGIVRAINESTMFADTMRVFTCPDCRALNAFWAPRGCVWNGVLPFAMVLSRKMLQIRYKPWKIHDDQQ
jgi:hypothetical protein